MVPLSCEMEDGHERNGPSTVIDIEEETTTKKKKSSSFSGSIRSIFMQADSLDWLLMVAGIVGSVGDGFSTPFMFFLASKLLNDVGGASSSSSDAFSSNVNRNAVALLYLACGQWVASFMEGYCWTRTSERQARRMATKYLKAVMRQDVGYFDMQVSSVAEVVTTLSNDNLLIQEVLSEKIPNFLMNVTNFLGFYLVGFLILWRLVIVGLPFVVLLVIPGLIYGRTLIKLARKAREEYNKASDIAAQAITSIRTVYAFVGERKTTAAYSSALEIPLRLGLRQGLAKGFALGSNGIVFAIWSFLCYYGSRLVMYHHVQGGTVFVVGAGIVIGGVSFGSALSNLKYISEACSAAERIVEVTRRVPKIDLESTEGDILDNVRGEVEFNHVKFAYLTRPENLIFEDFNLQIEAAKTVALVGSSGSGKSTAIALLQRFYDPLGGQILLDGVAIGKLQLRWLRSQIGLVSQEPALFATTIKENILFGKEDATMEEVIDAAKASNAHNFISQLPQGYDTQVGEGGVQMSGGQKQRIAIARAIIRAPRILLLDEATSALDSESEQVVQEALDTASTGCTTIIVSHRLSTIRNADIIAVMQNGKAMELGSHDDLMNINEGIYASLVSLQKVDMDTIRDDVGTGDRLISVPRSVSVVSRSSSVNSTQWPPTLAGGRDSQAEEQKLPVPSFPRLLALNLPEMKQMVLGCLGAILFGGVHPVYSYTMGSMVSIYFSEDHDEIKEKTRIYSLSFLALAFCSLLFNVIQHYNFGYMGEHLTKRVREQMFSKVLTFEVGWFDQEENSSGAILSRLAKDANVVKNLVGDRMSLLVQTMSAVVVACTMGLIIAWRLAIVMIAVQPLIIGCIYTQRVLLRGLSKKAIKVQGESSKVAMESVSNLRTITAFSSQGRILRMLETSQEGPRKEIARQSVYAGIGLGVSNSLLTCAVVLSFWYGSKLIRHGYITGKELFETYMILISTGRVIADAGSITSDLAKGSETVGSIFSILDRYSVIEPDDTEGYEPERITGHVELCNVDFAYPSRPDVMVFRSLSIDIKAGKSTALVGPSGSGKSTIIALIERFYDPISGIIKIDGRDIRSYNLRSLRKHIALVSQEPVLFTGTIRDNIAYGAPDSTNRAEIIDAARSANAHDFISGLPDGYDTLCGDKGRQLSGGQKQRIAIARAILKNSGMLLLDEATSALDNQSEHLVQDALERVMVGRTSVVVAHRLSTIRKCDLIVVLDKGNVVEKGSHSFLLAKGSTGAYHSLVSLQGAYHL